GGKTFEAERDLRGSDYGSDNATVAADSEGNVWALWTGGVPSVRPDPKSPAASPIVPARSAHNGQNFPQDEPLRSDTPVSGRACGCCRLEARAGADDYLYVGFRGGYLSIRDPYLLKGRKTENDFKCLRVSEDNWEFS